VPAIKLDNENIGGHYTPLQLEPGHRTTRSVIMAGSGRVSGQSYI